MLTIHCTGTPYELGFAHGTQARTQVHGTISFYRSLFATTTKKSWPEVLQIASQFQPSLKAKWPALLDEMAGLADGAQVELLDIIAINVRTEINFGLFSDGCTALSWKVEGNSERHGDGGEGSYLAQNWDWMREQKGNLVCAEIRGKGKPVVKMITEAGLIGKIGLNECGVGVCLNAIRAKGMSVGKLPCHLALRLVLERRSREEAMKVLDEHGVASACHILIADGSGGSGGEWSAEKGAWLDMDQKGRVFHSNHYISDALKGSDTQWLEDSTFRIKRIGELCDQVKEPSLDSIQGLFRDEANYPGAICRKQVGDCHSETLFNIVMDLKQKRAKVILGRPMEPDEEFEMSF